MNYRRLGNSGLFVSEICFGVMTFTANKGWTHVGNIEQPTANKLVNYALDNGVNFFDTADVYSNGISEIMLGKALGKKRRDAVITTKVGFRMEDGINGDGLSKRRILKACEDSLKRLNTDYIDLYVIHSDDFSTPIEETLSAMDQLVRDGKVRYTGCSNYTSWQLVKAMYEADKHGYQKFINLQAYYTLLGRELELDILPACIDQKIGVTVWGPLHGGILSGKYHNVKKWPRGTRIKSNEFNRPHSKETELKVLNELERISNERSMSIAQVSLNYLLRKKGIASVIIGATNQKQLRENIKTSDFELSKEEVKILDDITEPAPYYPHWYFNVYRKDNYEKNYKI
ncbi:MAG: aldo/keto reductase [Melioribacteraceae bacterium]|nr:aldo/keto reductase [Melioribacteraceae bacterium]MCF8353534.1 aldo/keto reductase [Melioribacteraceae bacterium]MCF8392532.1 aldo/keto reductase [Melioribacteraceae bacterium]MCF8418453.1 aldo/keto reductase [Melioribacteraceae bacterium]